MGLEKPSRRSTSNVFSSWFLTRSHPNGIKLPTPCAYRWRERKSLAASLPADAFPPQEELAMQGPATNHSSTTPVAVHSLDPEDAAITAAMRAMVGSTKGVPRGVEARGQFDTLMESVLPRDDVTFEADTVGGVPGVWVHPADWRPDEAIVHLHGGWFNFGSAKAYRHLVGQIAARAGARAFIPNYRLAPEHPFPAAVEDA